MSNFQQNLTVPEVAKILVTGPAAIRSLIAKGDLSFFRVGRQIRVSQERLQQFIAAGGSGFRGPSCKPSLQARVN